MEDSYYERNICLFSLILMVKLMHFANQLIFGTQLSLDAGWITMYLIQGCRSRGCHAPRFEKLVYLNQAGGQIMSTTTCPPDFQIFLRHCCIHMQSERIKNVLVHFAKAVQHSHKHPSHHKRKNERVTCDMFHCFTLPSPTSGKAELTLAAAPWASAVNFVLKSYCL